MMQIRPAAMEDLAWLAAHDHHVAQGELANLIGLRRVLVCEMDGALCGWLRWNLFWDNTPFMNMLYVLDEYRGRGMGRWLVLRWEAVQKERGYSVVMTSTQSNEDAQHFYRKMGYRDAGSLILPGEPLEIIFQKELH